MLPKHVMETLEQVIRAVNLQDAEIEALKKEVEELKKSTTNSRRSTKST